MKFKSLKIEKICDKNPTIFAKIWLLRELNFYFANLKHFKKTKRSISAKFALQISRCVVDFANLKHKFQQNSSQILDFANLKRKFQQNSSQIWSQNEPKIRR